MYGLSYRSWTSHFYIGKKKYSSENKTSSSPWMSGCVPWPHVFMVQSGTTMTRITVQVAAAIRAPILHNLARRNSASFRFNSES